ncbi:MAG TPA: SIS domain-containing protein [Streptosporangiaceae bacterium]|jgi:D-sedoheptulose 7-phosphate isomerase
MTSVSPHDGAAGSVETLYPFLYPDQAGAAGSLTAVLDSVRASTVAKTAEILQLRQQVLEAAGIALAACASQMAARFDRGGRLLAFGNGGSATDAQELATLFLAPGGTARPLPALSLASDPAVLTALCNDIGVDVVFARQVAAFGTSADIAVALSTSGNSENLLRGLAAARQRGMLAVGIAGYNGGKMAEMDGIDYLFVAPSASVHRIQEAQTTMYHALWELCQAALEPAGRRSLDEEPGPP